MIQDEASNQRRIDLQVQIENSQRRYKYICPEANCLIPEILFTNSTLEK
jgi:hypothetical protein